MKTCLWEKQLQNGETKAYIYITKVIFAPR